MSRVGKKPIDVPQNVEVNCMNNEISVKGPKGSLFLTLDKTIQFEQADKTIVLQRADDSNQQKALHGLYRSLLQNMIIGVTTGFKKELMIQGVGYKAQMKGKKIVLDLGSGAGFDAFLASKKVGYSGKVIGVDFTEEMVEKARELAEKYNKKNVEFSIGDIENLPIENESIDVIISNCVINLAPDKLKVFKEAYRVLKKTGRMFVSDIVLLSELTEEQKSNDELIAGCVGGALLKDDYLAIITKSGFSYRILDEDFEISKRQYKGINLESLKVELYK